MPASVAPATADPAVVDATARLTAALDGLSGGYTFATTVKVGGVVATQAKGRSIGGNAQFNITAKGVTVTYRSVPPNAWVRQANGKWTKLDGGSPVVDLVSTLRTPDEVAVVTDADGVLVLRAVYPAAALGAGKDGHAAVQLTLAANGSIRLVYTPVVDPATGTTGEASATLTPSPDQQPITAP